MPPIERSTEDILRENLHVAELITARAFKAAYDGLTFFLGTGTKHIDILTHPLFPVYATLYIKVLKGE